MGEQGYETTREGAKAAFNLTLGLRDKHDQMDRAKPALGTLACAFPIAAPAVGTGPEEAESVGVSVLGQARFLEGLPEMVKVLSSGVGLDETAREVEAEIVIRRKQESPLGGRGSPLADGTVVMPKLANASAKWPPWVLTRTSTEERAPTKPQSDFGSSATN